MLVSRLVPALSRIATTGQNLSRHAGLAAILTLSALSTAALNADEVTLHNGNTLEGTIIDETDSAVVINLVVGSGHASMTIKRDQIASIDKSKGASGSVAGAAPKEVKKKEPVKHNEAGWPMTDYLLIDVSGVIGQQVTASGIDKALNWAGANDVLNIVFYVDVKAGGSIDETRKIAQLIKRRHGRYAFHVLAASATDSGLAFVLHADALYFVNGGQVGGTAGLIDDKAEDAAGELARIAYAAGQAAKQNGADPHIIRSMIDPAETIALGIKETADGDIDVVGGRNPESLGDIPVIASADATTRLLINAKQADQLGVPTVNSAQDIGALIELPNWKEAETDVGTRFITEAAQAQVARQAREDKRMEDRVRRCERKRQETKAMLDNYIAQAKGFDPKKGDYATKEYYSNGNWGGRVRRVNGGNKKVYRNYNDNYGGKIDSKQFTKDSRQEWRNRSQMTLQYIQRAISSCSSAIKLEKEAARLGLAPMYEPGYLKGLRTDLQSHYQMVASEAGRKGR
jgi:hypothetical protein